MADAFEHWLPQRIASATQCPESAIRQHWPAVVAALDVLGIADRLVQAAAIATIAIETASRFAPIHEFRNADGSIPAIWHTYDGGPEFHGRGFIQITHRSNYRRYGDMLGVDLVAAPDRALEPKIAADILALYFANHGGGPLIPEAARRGDWREVRRLVQGGSAGLDRFVAIVTALGGTSMPVTYNRAEPAHPQDKSFDCSQESLEWALWALGRKPADGWLEATMIAEGVMSAQNGLLDASGAGLAAFVNRHYGEFGFKANHEPAVTWSWAVREGGHHDGSGHAYPVLLGGRKFGAEGHWVGLRDYDPSTRRLLLANPSDGYDGIFQAMTEAQFNARAPWSAVRIWHADLLAPTPDPPPMPPLPPAPTLAEVKAALIEMTSVSDDKIVGRVLREQIASLVERMR